MPTDPPSPDGRRLALGVDTLAVYLVRGVDTTATGLIVDAVSVGEAGGRSVLQRVYETRDQVLGSRLDSLTDELTTLAPVRHRSRTSRSVAFLEFRPGRATGMLHMPNGDSLVVDVQLPAVVFNSSSFDLVLRASPLAEGWRAEIPAFLPNIRGVVTLHARVAGQEAVQGVPCWRVEAEFTGTPVTFWITRDGRKLRQQAIVALGQRE